MNEESVHSLIAGGVGCRQGRPLPPSQSLAGWEQTRLTRGSGPEAGRQSMALESSP